MDPSNPRFLSICISSVSWFCDLWIQPTVGKVVLYLLREKSGYKWTSAV